MGIWDDVDGDSPFRQKLLNETLIFFFERNLIPSRSLFFSGSICVVFDMFDDENLYRRRFSTTQVVDYIALFMSHQISVARVFPTDAVNYTAHLL